MEFSLDLVENSASLKISKEIYLRILSKAIVQTEQDLKDLDAALPVSDFSKVQSIAHRLKGDYANMRVMPLSVIAKQINDIARTSQDKQQLNDLAYQFKDYFRNLKNYITKAS